MKEATKTVYISNDGKEFPSKSDVIEHEYHLMWAVEYEKIYGGQEFTVTDDHLILLKKTRITWLFLNKQTGYGYFLQNVINPYDTEGKYPIDAIANIIGIDPEQCNWHSRQFDLEKYRQVVITQLGMGIVVQILTNNLSIQTGKYTRATLTSDWQLAAQ